MPWQNDRDSRCRTSVTYGATYRRNRDKAMRRARWRCELRLDGCIGAASECDHIVSVADGGGHEVSNLRAACGPCHKQRTAQQGHDARRGGRSATDPPCTPRTSWLRFVFKRLQKSSGPRVSRAGLARLPVSTRHAL